MKNRSYCRTLIATVIVIFGYYVTPVVGQTQSSDPPARPSQEQSQPINPNESGEPTKGGLSVIVTVREREGTLIAGATIVMTGPEKKVYIATTDNSGRASLGGLSAARYQVDVSAANYESRRVTLSLGSKAVTNLRVTLSKAHGR
jgi:hypothetical protein